MKKIVLTFGIISGAILSIMMLATVSFIDRIGFDRAEVIGYATIVASFLLVFFGVRAYRRVVQGPLTFGRALTVGLLITLVSSACYVATWELVYFKLAPGYSKRYADYAVERAQASGAAPHELEATRRQMETFKRMYDNPLTNAAITFLEPAPIGIVVSLISAAVLRSKT